MTLEDGADWSVVTGDRFRERRIHLNLTQSELADEAGIKSYETVGAVERGEGSPASRRRIEEALTRLEAEVGVHAQESEQPTEESADPIRLTFRDVYGVGEIVAEGPADKGDELVEAVVKLLAEMRAKGTE